MNRIDDRFQNELDERDSRNRELLQIRDALSGLRFGSVKIIVQDGIVIQIDRTEKHRLRATSSKKPARAEPT